MERIADIPFFEIEFRKSGQLHTSDAMNEVASFLRDNAITDLLVCSHGWNNDKADARALYEGFFGNAALHLAADAALGLPDRKFVFLGIYWPSKKFTDAELIPGGGAASLGDEEDPDDLLRLLDSLKTEPDRLGDEQPIDAAKIAAIERAKELVPELEADPAAREEFVEQIRSILPRDEAHADDGSDRFFSRSAEALFEDAATPVPPPDEGAGDTGGAAGGVSGLGALGDEGGAAGRFGDLFNGMTSAARRLLNFTTYYRMKARAGTVGVKGLGPALVTIHDVAPALRLHLVGHSFGGRVVTAAVHELPPGTNVHSLSLLQAAFSHNAFADKFDGIKDGFFRTVVTGRKVNGPVIITYTQNDKAVGVAYPLASRIAGQNAAGLGDRDDPYGGLGRNGAISTPEARDEILEETDFDYDFTGGALHNLKADRFISDHGAVAGLQVTYAVVAATRT
jgi:hypothetical protein